MPWAYNLNNGYSFGPQAPRHKTLSDECDNQDLTGILLAESKGREIGQEEFDEGSFFHQEPPPMALIRGGSGCLDERTTKMKSFGGGSRAADHYERHCGKGEPLIGEGGGQEPHPRAPIRGGIGLADGGTTGKREKQAIHITLNCMDSKHGVNRKKRVKSNVLIRFLSNSSTKRNNNFNNINNNNRFSDISPRQDCTNDLLFPIENNSTFADAPTLVEQYESQRLAKLTRNEKNMTKGIENMYSNQKADRAFLLIQNAFIVSWTPGCHKDRPRRQLAASSLSGSQQKPGRAAIAGCHIDHPGKVTKNVSRPSCRNQPTGNIEIQPTENNTTDASRKMPKNPMPPAELPSNIVTSPNFPRFLRSNQRGTAKVPPNSDFIIKKFEVIFPSRKPTQFGSLLNPASPGRSAVRNLSIDIMEVVVERSVKRHMKLTVQPENGVATKRESKNVQEISPKFILLSPKIFKKKSMLYLELVTRVENNRRLFCLLAHGSFVSGWGRRIGCRILGGGGCRGLLKFVKV
ncbi:hypothetical protein M5K25_025367 [Dendrobium thyrsiflorum]|uniref:Uncharacterized protein n=1 Tax=Dendrobium thyrsiflorum TaxID=117978 RepID=A0ABD0U434_DENTH